MCWSETPQLHCNLVSPDPGAIQQSSIITHITRLLGKQTERNGLVTSRRRWRCADCRLQPLMWCPGHIKWASSAWRMRRRYCLPYLSTRALLLKVIDNDDFPLSALSKTEGGGITTKKKNLLFTWYDEKKGKIPDTTHTGFGCFNLFATAAETKSKRFHTTDELPSRAMWPRRNTSLWLLLLVPLLPVIFQKRSAVNQCWKRTFFFWWTIAASAKLTDKSHCTPCD